MNLADFKIVSGGQTGTDRTALDWAIANNVPHGGWCPKGRKSEDGPLDARYLLNETPRADYLQRTEWNARDSDGTVVFSISPILTGGSNRTVELAEKHRRPVVHISKAEGVQAAVDALKNFIDKHKIRVLNVAGPRGSKEPEVAAFVKEVLDGI